MNAYSSSGGPSEKRAVLPGWAAAFFHQVRLFWLSELILLGTVGYGLRAGWSTQRQWSDGFFLAAAIQVLIASITFLAPQHDAIDASLLRYVPGSNIADTRKDMVMDMLRQRAFAVRVFFGALLTMLISGLIVWL